MAAVMGAASALRVDRAFAATVAPQPFRVPLKIPRVLQPVARRDGIDYYETTMRRGRAQILQGPKTPIWSFDGGFPGPTIKAMKGRTVVIRRTNSLRVPATIHLHGGRVRPEHDGQPTDLIAPGETKRYVYPNRQDAAMLWYHDHTHHHTSRNNYMGLSGLYIVEDDDERELNLPKGRYDIPLVLQDRTFNSDGSFRFRDHHGGVWGKTFLVNGRPMPYLKVANRKYRFRILNMSHTRGYRLSLDNGQPLVQIATDGGLLPAPQPQMSIPLWPAERAEVVIDFSKYPVGTQIVLEHRKDPRDPTSGRPVMRFQVEREEPDDSSLPAMLRPFAPITQWSVERQFVLSFDEFKRQWQINGKRFNPDRIDARPRLNDTELWTFRNNSSSFHPMHIHLVQFQVVSRSNMQLSANDLGWKDTVRVDPASSASVAMKWDGYTGRYMFHCHNLAHEDHSMMGQVQVVS